MKLLGGNAHFTAKTEFAAIGKSGRGVYIHRGAVYALGKQPGGSIAARDNGLTVSGGVSGNVRYGFVNPTDHLYCQNIVQKFRIEVFFPCRCAGDDFCCFGIQSKFHRMGGILRQAGAELWQKFPGNGLIHQKYLFGIAHTGAAGLGVFHNGQRHSLIGAFFNIHVANTCAGGNTGYSGSAQAGADQPCTTSGNQKVYVAIGSHQLLCALM